MAQNEWSALGWKDPFWEIVRYYFSLRGKEQSEFRTSLKSSPPLDKASDWKQVLTLSPTISGQLENYLAFREKQLSSALGKLRTETEAQAFCKENDIVWKITATQSKDHHQSSKALIAAVTGIASKVCASSMTTLEPNPQRRCVWAIENHLHVTARNLDGAIPGLKNPSVVWEIKEYWGKTSGGSKMSDAVYECNLVGREIREFELRAKTKIKHYVFVDGREQWLTRKSDLGRFIDLESQGFIDRLFVGREVETDWESELTRVLKCFAPEANQ